LVPNWSGNYLLNANAPLARPANQAPKIKYKLKIMILLKIENNYFRDILAKLKL